MGFLEGHRTKIFRRKGQAIARGPCIGLSLLKSVTDTKEEQRQVLQGMGSSFQEEVHFRGTRHGPSMRTMIPTSRPQVSIL